MIPLQWAGGDVSIYSFLYRFSFYFSFFLQGSFKVELRTPCWGIWYPISIAHWCTTWRKHTLYCITKWEAGLGKSLDDPSWNKFGLILLNALGIFLPRRMPTSSFPVGTWPQCRWQNLSPLYHLFVFGVVGNLGPFFISGWPAIRFWTQVCSLIRSVLNILLATVASDSWEALLYKLITSLTKVHGMLVGFVFLAARQTFAKAWRQLFLNFA